MPSRFSCGLPLVLTKMLIYETERLTIAYTPIAGPPDVETVRPLVFGPIIVTNWSGAWEHLLKRARCNY
jgi:hypothetical protein